MFWASPRSICAPAEPAAPNARRAELQAGRGGFGALANQLEREFTVFRLGIVVEDFKPVHDRADRTNEIVADPRAQQGRKFERVGGGSGRRGARHEMFLDICMALTKSNRACPLV
jgi:hypothetical protein